MKKGKGEAVGENIVWGRGTEHFGKKIKIKKMGMGKNIKKYGTLHNFKA